MEGGGPGRREEGGGAHDTRLKLDTKEIELIIDLYFKNIFFLLFVDFHIIIIIYLFFWNFFLLFEWEGGRGEGLIGNCGGMLRGIGRGRLNNR